MKAIVRRIGPLRSAVRHRRRRRFTRNLVRLNDALAGSPLDGRWWVWSGMLLGWAGEGRLLGHDLFDADFAYRDEDHDRFLACVPILEAAGFARAGRFENNDGLITEHRFGRDGAVFEFFRLVPDGADLTYWTYAWVPTPVQCTARVVDQPIEPFTFLGRTWQKPVDHEGQLEAMYGDWRTPRPDWSYLDEPSIVAKDPWRDPSEVWS